MQTTSDIILLVDEKLVSKFFNEKKIIIPKNNNFSFQENAEITISEAGKTIFNSIIKKKAIYSIIGKYHVNTPRGKFEFDVKLIEVNNIYFIPTFSYNSNPFFLATCLAIF